MVKWNKLHYQKHGLLMGALFWSLPPLVFIMTVLFGIYGDTIVKEALTGAYSEQSIQLINTAGVTLRARHVESDINALQNTTLASNLSVVLARGLRSNLNSWLDFGEELTREGRDTWLIELTGGPGQDCPSCINYNFTNLTQQYFPALIAHVLNGSIESKIDYVGFSNGCRVALSSLEGGYVNPNKINTLITVGCPGSFEGDSTLKDTMTRIGDFVSEDLKGDDHVSAGEFGKAIISNCYRISNLIARKRCERIAQGLTGDSQISRNLGEKYKEWMQSDSDSQPGSGVTIVNHLMIYGTLPNSKDLVSPGESDGVATVDDAAAINNQLTASGTKGNIKEVKGTVHTSDIKEESLPDNKKTESIINKFLNKLES